MVRLRPVFLFGIVLVLGGAAAPPAAQTASHQRLGVRRVKTLEIAIGATLGISGSDADESAGLDLDAALSLDILYMSRFGLSFELPIVARVALRGGAGPGGSAALGDPSVAASCSFRLADWRLGAELSYAHPLGVWETYESAEKRIISGSGFPRLSATLTAIRYLDPLIAGIRLGAETCLARRDRFGETTKPLTLNLSLFATEALNAEAALSAGITQRLAWPSCLNGKVGTAGMAWSLSGNASLIFSQGSGSFRFGASKLLNDAESPVAFDLGFQYSIGEKE